MSRTPPSSRYPETASRISRQESVLVVQNVKPKPKLPIHYNNEFRPTTHSACPIQQQQESPEEAQLKSTLARVYNETPTAKADVYKGVMLPRPNGRIQIMKKHLPLAISILLVLVSFLLTGVATALPDWFVIDVPGYSANYGVLKASFHCKSSSNISSSSTNNTANQFAQVCHIGSYTCINALMCKPLISFQVFSIGACVITAVLCVTALSTQVFNLSDTRTVIRVRIAKLALTFLAFGFQLLSLAFFVVFKNRAVTSFNSPSVSGLFIAGEVLPQRIASMQSLSIPNSAFGSYGSSLVLMAVGAVLSAVSFGMFGMMPWKKMREV
ncbi:hypothetical protein BJ741DRAFT_629653 [Chytriomyces cf. hyalinus JEL632]|nr:hypothetical protein BJ741DRAFT_629653 [Chytriomyces cf. hyalinus JEL632]